MADPASDPCSEERGAIILAHKVKLAAIPDVLALRIQAEVHPERALFHYRQLMHIGPVCGQSDIAYRHIAAFDERHIGRPTIQDKRRAVPLEGDIIHALQQEPGPVFMRDLPRLPLVIPHRIGHIHLPQRKVLRPDRIVPFFKDDCTRLLHRFQILRQPDQRLSRVHTGYNPKIFCLNNHISTSI